MSQKADIIIKQIQAQGYRITEQRKNLISVILENEFATCKEIYYSALAKDPTVGIATVYRTVGLLEKLGVLNRNNIFDVAYENIIENKNGNENVTFVCTKCGDTSDLEVAAITITDCDGTQRRQRVLNGTIKGICAKCEEMKDDGRLYNSGNCHINCSRCSDIACKVS